MKSPFPQHVYKRNAEIYKIMANHKRLEILNILKLRPCTVEQLCRIIGARKANISQHLAVLRNCRIVEAHRSGVSVRYSIVDSRIVEPCRILKNLFNNSR